jgi:diguanylate cyclase (GGDEF)-like protein
MFLLALLQLAHAAPSASTPAPASVPDLPPHQRVWSQWTVAEGLPQITVSDILQDRAGYLWLATQDGIARFDGVAFRNYTLAEHPGLGHGVVNALGLDRDGALWIGTMSGIARFVDGRIVPVQVEGAGTGMVLGVEAHPDGGVWVSAENGLFHARGRKAVRVRFGTDPMPMVTVLQPEYGAELALGHFHLVIDPAGEPRVVELYRQLPAVISGVLARDGGLWLGTINGLYRTDREGRPQGAVLAKGREIQSVLEEPDGTLWIATDRGLLRHRPGGDVEPVVVPGIDATAWVCRLFMDREGSLWLGTQLTGLHRTRSDRFRRFTARDGLVDGAVWSVYEAPDGEIWAGTPDGLYRGGLDGFRLAIPGRDLPHPNVTAMLRDRRQGLWVGTYTELVHRPAGSARLVPVPKVGKTGIFALVEAPGGDVMVGALDGLYRLPDAQPTRAERIKLPGMGDGLNVTGLAHGRDGRLWAAYDGGIAYQDGKRWVLAPVPEGTRPRGAVLTAFADGMLAAGLDGLFYVDPEQARKLGRADGLHVDTVHSVLVGDRDVWYQGPRGVGRIGADALQALLRGERTRVDVDVFGDLGSAQMAQCNGGHQASGVLGQGRWLWCPDLQGLMAFDTARADDLAPAPQARLQALVTPQRRIRLATAGPGALELAPGEHDLQIEYTGVHLRAADRLRFQGRLVGYDAEWRALDRRRTAYYTNLPAGQYTYELYAINEDGVRGPTVSVPFGIRAHWYETSLARSSAVIALLLFIAAGVRWRLHALHRQRQVLEARVRKRTGQLEAANEALEAMNRKLEEASVTDPLTGLHNRRYLLEHLPHELARLDRLHAPAQASADVLTFLHLDLDNFKRINDTHGHRVGDQVLQIAADLLRRNSRAADFVLRWGGEELLVIGHEAGRDGAHAWATRIVESFREHVFETDVGPLHVTCSIGHAVYPMLPGHRDGLGWEAVMNLADAATYLAKSEGRDRCIGFELLRGDVPDDFFMRAHADPRRLEVEGWIRIRREVRCAVDMYTPMTVA